MMYRHILKSCLVGLIECKPGISTIQIRRALPDASVTLIHKVLTELQKEGIIIRDERMHARYFLKVAI